MRISYLDDYFVTLPEGHPFPMGKFTHLYRILLRERLVSAQDIMQPHEASWDDLGLVHHSDYLDRLANGTLEPKEERRLGLPWSETLLKRSRISVQGTINAARMAMQDGIAANIGGGTHHAFPDHGEGFCVFNDVAVAIRVLLRDCDIQRALVVDLDVHQGNGTAAIFSGDERVYTFSMHGEKNYPWRKPPSTIDVGLSDGFDDTGYLTVLEEYLGRVFDEARPDVVFYLAGVDTVQGDRFGKLALTRAGLHQRERYVLQTAHQRAIPVTILMAGGYASTPQETAELHAIVHREASLIY